MERELGGMRWIWWKVKKLPHIMEEGESDQYGSARSCSSSPDNIEVVTCDAGGWLHFLVSHRYSAEAPLKVWVLFEDGSLYEACAGESVEHQAEARSCADVLDIQELGNGCNIILPHK